MKIIHKALGAVEWFEKVIASVIFIIMFLCFIYQITMRYLFSPVNWTQEAISACFLWMLVFATCFADQTDENIKFTSFYDARGPLAQIFCDILSSALVVFSFTILIPEAIDYVAFQRGIASDNLPSTFGDVYSCVIYLLIAFWVKYFRRLIRCGVRLVRYFKKEDAAV